MTTINENRPAEALRADDRRDEELHDSTKPLGGISGWVDDRTGAAKGAAFLLKKVFPDHWSFMLGEIAMYSMIVCLLTGAFLTFWFVPSQTLVPYDGSYIPLQGILVSDAYSSTLDISFDIRGGLLIRQIHHWGALIFIVAVFAHMARVFFTGAFRKPREINWVFGTILSMLACIEGFAGYSLPDDLLSGTGIRAMNGFIQSIPVIGSYVSYFLFGGAFPGEAIVPRLYSVHILLIPAILVALFTAHILLVFVHKHTQYPGPGRTNNNVVGYPLMPVYIAKAGGFFFMVFGVIALISALFTINPIWAYGPYDPSPITAGSQPDWYMGFADGALRLLPGWLEFVSWGDFTWSMNIFPGSILLLPIMWTIIGVYPFVEAWVTGDKREHHLLDRPRNAPTRTGDRRRRHHDVLRALLRRRQRPHGDQAAPVDQRHHDGAAHAVLHRPAHRLLDHEAHLPQPPAGRPAEGAARSRDRHHLALPRRPLRGDPRAAHAGGAVAARPARGARAAADRCREGRQRCRQPGRPQGATAGQAVALLLRRPRRTGDAVGARGCAPRARRGACSAAGRRAGGDRALGCRRRARVDQGRQAHSTDDHHPRGPLPPRGRALGACRCRRWKTRRMHRLSDAEFEQAVGDALDSIPPELAQAMDNVVVLVEPEPPEDDPDLLGVYDGVPLTERDGWWEAGSLPDRITIFQGPLERFCDSPEQLREEIAVTVVHEIAHHFGISDEQLHELGWG